MEWIRIILRTFRVSFPLFYVRDEGIFVCLLAPIRDSFRSIFFYQVLDITYIHVSSFTTVYFETTFSFILKHIACAKRTTSGNKFVEIDRGG